MTTVSQGNGGPAAVPLTGQQYQISAGRYRATVTELGAGLRELLYHCQPVIAGYEPNELPPGGAGQLLAPWPNRIDGGRYIFGGAEYQLALTEPAHGNAIHGLTRWTAWTPVSHDASAVLLRSARMAIRDIRSAWKSTVEGTMRLPKDAHHRDEPARSRADRPGP